MQRQRHPFQGPLREGVFQRAGIRPLHLESDHHCPCQDHKREEGEGGQMGRVHRPKEQQDGATQGHSQGPQDALHSNLGGKPLLGG